MSNQLIPHLGNPSIQTSAPPLKGADDRKMLSFENLTWAPIDKRAYSLPVNTLLLLAANTATKIAATVEHPGLQELAYRIGNRLRPQIAAFYDRQAGAFSARLEPGVAVSREHPRSSMKMENPARPADHPAAHGIHGNILACLTGCGSDKQRRSAAAFVARCLRQDPNGVEAQFGPAWTDRLLQPLFPRGHAGAALSCIESLYGAFIDHGAPTWAELFGRGEFNSAHGWGASVNSLIAESIVGLKPAAPGWRRMASRRSESESTSFPGTTLARLPLRLRRALARIIHQGITSALEVRGFSAIFAFAARRHSRAMSSTAGANMVVKTRAYEVLGVTR